jgi:hypothetical protein
MEDDPYFKLAQQVFIEFARFEYCLKVSGFLRLSDGPASPDWDSFAHCGEMRQLFEDIKSDDAIPCQKLRYLLDRPPKKQAAASGRLHWEEAPRIASSQDYFGALKRVRNNLFHGGKFNGEFFEPERSAKLLEAVLCVLKTARERHPKIAEAYIQKSE